MIANNPFEREALTHIDALRHFAFQLSRNKQSTEDLVQETMLKACTYFDSYKEGTNCRAWLFQICKNSYINAYRRKQYEPFLMDFTESALQSPLESDGVHETHPPTVDEAATKAHANFLSDEVISALETLPDDYQTAVILSDIEGYTYKEVATFTHSPIGTVRSRIHRGRKALTSQLSRFAYESGYLSRN